MGESKEDCPHCGRIPGTPHNHSCLRSRHSIYTMRADMKEREEAGARKSAREESQRIYREQMKKGRRS